MKHRLQKLIAAGLLLLSATAVAEPFRVGDHAYLCLQRTLHPNWPEFFAIKVEIVKVLERRVKVRVIDDYPMAGRTNEEETPVKGDVMKFSKARVYSPEQAGVVPGERFEGKPVCSKLMTNRETK